MRATRWAGLTLAIVLAPALLAGCGQANPQTAGPAPGSTASGSTESPTTPAPSTPDGPDGAPGATSPPPDDPYPTTLKPPSGAPQTPTDLVPTGVIVGVIRVVGDSCYTLETDENKQYALVGDGPALAPGATVRVKIAKDRPSASTCAGEPVLIVDLEIVS